MNNDTDYIHAWTYYVSLSFDRHGFFNLTANEYTEEQYSYQMNLFLHIAKTVVDSKGDAEAEYGIY